MLLKVENLTKRFEGLIAVNNVGFHVNAGEILTVIGPNGAGKSTLFNLISGIVRPTSGRVYLQEEDVTDIKPHRITNKGIARTFQTTALFDQLRVVDNLAIAHKLRTKSSLLSTILHTRSWKNDQEKTKHKIMQTLEFIGMQDKALNFASTLSQQEQKRLAIGIALAGNPKIILLDEPTGGLIQEDTDAITNLIKKMKASGITVCLIEHKMRIIMDLADRIVVLNYGSKIAEGTPEEVSNNQEVIDAYLGGEFIA